MTENVIDLAPFQPRIDRHDNASGFQTANVTQRRFGAVQKVYRDPVARLRACLEKIHRDVAGEAVKL